MPAPKRTKTQREADRAETARLDRMGFSQREIAERIGVSAMQINADLKTIRKRYVEQANVNAGERIGELLAGYRDVRQQAWLAWEKSWEDAQRVSERATAAGNVITTTHEGRLPGAQYLATILATYEHERKLLGLDTASQADFLTADAVVTLANAIMAAIARRVSDPQLVQAMKADVLAMLPQSIRPADVSPAALVADADEPPDGQQLAPPEPDTADAQASVDPVPDPDMAGAPMLNGVLHPSDGDDYFEPV